MRGRWRLGDGDLRGGGYLGIHRRADEFSDLDVDERAGDLRSGDRFVNRRPKLHGYR